MADKGHCLQAISNASKMLGVRQATIKVHLLTDTYILLMHRAKFQKNGTAEICVLCSAGGRQGPLFYPVRTSEVCPTAIHFEMELRLLAHNEPENVLFHL